MTEPTFSHDRKNWQRASLAEGTGLVFEEDGGLDQALSDGFFFLRPPTKVKLWPGDRFAQEFYRPSGGTDTPFDRFRGFTSLNEDRLGKHQGYFCRDQDQTEQFFLESASWPTVYPVELAEQAEAMRSLAVEVLRAVLVHLDVPEYLWDTATGHSLSGRGTYTLTFNHFRPEKRARGLNVHKDSGWVTVLRSVEPGLEAYCGGLWKPVDPVEGMFIVNFGCAMEILTRRTRRPVAAVPHRVREQPLGSDGAPDRFSYALFVDSTLDETLCPGLYSYNPGDGLEFEGRFSDFLDTILANTYDRDNVGLY